MMIMMMMMMMMFLTSDTDGRQCRRGVGLCVAGLTDFSQAVILLPVVW